MFLLWEGGPQCDPLSHFGRYVSFYAAGMEDGEDKTPGGYMMISPRVAAELRRAENVD